MQRESESSNGPQVWRRQMPVLVFESNAMGSVAVIRSLGRAGYPVHACARSQDALGFLSNYASARVVCPPYESREFLPWLYAYIRQHHIRAFIPSESLLLAIRPVFSEFAHLIPFQEQEQVLYRGMSKFDLFEFLLGDHEDAGVKAHLPPTILVRNLQDPPKSAALEKLRVPLYIKVDGAHSTTGEEGSVYKAHSVSDTYQQLQNLAPHFRRAIIQGYVEGQGVGAFFLRWNSQLQAQFMHRRLHEVPYTGGLSSLRESWWHAGIRRDALTKIEAFGWSGVAMFEYRWDEATDRFFLMEMNGRFWGSLHLALYTGVDFPRLLLDAFHGHSSPVVEHYPQGVRCRLTFPLEVQHVWSRVKDAQLPLSSRLCSILEFIRLSCDPRIYSDLFFPGDTRLYWESIWRFIRSFRRK